MNVLIVNGANINMTGSRERVYGTMTLDEINAAIRKKAKSLNVDVEFFQSNHEGAIIDRLQQGGFDALIINPGAFSHYSYAIADCLRALSVPKIEVHLSNIYSREEFRHKSVTAAACNGSIAGFLHNSYILALIQLCSL